MFAWLVTLRGAEGTGTTIEDLLTERLLPLLRSQRGCTAPAAARCVNCAGEVTYMATWTDRERLEAFEASDAYKAIAGALAPHLRVPAKRELWEMLAS